MHFNLLQSKSGLPTLTVNGIFYHSRYNPRKEADKFLHENQINNENKYFIVIGSGLGYLYEALKKKYPYSHIICIYFTKEIYKLANVKPKTFWINGISGPLSIFLKNHLSEIDITDIKLIEWPPGIRIFSDTAKTVRSEISQFVREYAGNYRTTAAVGKRWFRNVFKNFRELENPIHDFYPITKSLSLVTASGPSMEKILKMIREYRKHILIFALPSSVLTLVSENITPDIIVATDPGYYTDYHLSFLNNNSPLIALPLTVSSLSHKNDRKIMLFSSNSFPERIIFNSSGINPLIFPSQGTVTVTAIEMAYTISTGPVVISGLDLCFYDINSHVRGGSSSFYFSNNANRLTPQYSQEAKNALENTEVFFCDRQIKYRTNPSLKAYAGWFDLRIYNNLQSKIYRVNNSPVKLKPFKNIDNDFFKYLVQQSPTFNDRAVHTNYFENYPKRKQRIEIINRITNSWLDKINRIKSMVNETDSYLDIMKDNDFLALSYYTNIRLLSSLRKSLITGKTVSAKETLDMLLEDMYKFIFSLKVANQ